jgi:hypothetical protein
VSFVTVSDLNLLQIVINADAAEPRDIVDGERPLSPAVLAASAAPGFHDMTLIAAFRLEPIPNEF